MTRLSGPRCGSLIWRTTRGALLALLGFALVGVLLLAPAASAQDGVFTWGDNLFGALGDGAPGPGGESDVPVELAGLSDVTAISRSGFGGVALLGNGTVMAWGEGAFGQLGDGGDPDESDVPVQVKGLSGAIAVAAGSQDDYALLSDGHVMGWGANESGQLLDGTVTGPETCVDEIPCSTVPVELAGLSGVTAIADAGYHALALLGNGTVMAWGRNEHGELGDGNTEDTDTGSATQVKGLTGVSAISGDAALLSDGRVMVWGANTFGELGDGNNTGPEGCVWKGDPEGPCSTVPLEVPGLSDVSAISDTADGGATDALALLGTGKVMAWGLNANGSLGDGTTKGPEECAFWAVPSQIEACSTVPVEVKEPADVTAIAGGPDDNFALLGNGRVLAWGRGSFGELGDGGTAESAVPVEVSGLREVAEISSAAALGTAPPAVVKLSPSQGLEAGGETVTITGVNFTGASAVEFGAASAVSYTVDSNSTITAVAPAGTGTVNVTVTNKWGVSESQPGDRFTYVPVGAPEFGRCVAVAKGHGAYSNAACDAAHAGGSFEWLHGTEKTGFTLAGAKSTLESVGKAKVTCASVSGSGSYNGPKAVEGVVLKFSGCVELKKQCSSTGAAAGEVVSKVLEGALVWQDKATKKVALDLLAAGEAGPLAQFACGATPLAIQGSLLSPVGVDKMQGSDKLKPVAAKGIQKPSEYELAGGGKVADFLEVSVGAGGLEPAGLTIGGLALTSEESLEIDTLI
jgi:alpha-tubulin suppressor-like RCC1 family protein